MSSLTKAPLFPLKDGQTVLAQPTQRWAALLLSMKKLRKRDGNILNVSANGNAAETPNIVTILLLHVSRGSRSAERNGNVNHQVSVTFPNYGNASVHPVHEFSKHPLV